MRTHRHLGNWIAVALVLAGTAGCSARGRRYLDPNMDFGAVRSVAVMPFANLTRETAAAERVRDVFATMLLSTGALSVVPIGEVQNAISTQGVATPAAPSTEAVTKLGRALKVDAIITGTVREYGEVRSGASSANVVSISVQMIETTSGKLVWSASSTRGGVSMADRLLGSSGTPMNQVTEEAVDDLIGQLFD